MFNFKRIITILLAFCIALVINYYFSRAEKFWLPLTTLIVVLTPIGSAIPEGVLRFLILSIFIFFVSIITSFSMFSPRLYDISLGTIIGILSNIFIFPLRPEVEFRKNIIPILKNYSTYLITILDIFLLKSDALLKAQAEKILLEKTLLKYTPLWIYKSGFHFFFRESQRHFLILVERIGQILFSMHHIARHSFDKDFLINFDVFLINYFNDAVAIMEGLVSILNLEKRPYGMSDLHEEILALEKKFQEEVPFSIELLDIAKDYIYFAALIQDLKDLREVLIKLVYALRATQTKQKD